MKEHVLTFLQPPHLVNSKYQITTYYFVIWEYEIDQLRNYFI